MSYSTSEGRFMQRDLIGYADGMNQYEFVHGNPVTGADPTGLYDETGHFYTVYLVAIAAGYSQEGAYNLAYYAQLPDQVSEFRAVDTIEAIGKADQMSAPFVEAWAKDVSQILHSLHGGNADEVKKRRECLLKMLKRGGRDGNSEGLTPTERGLIIHALGDAYAHTKADGTQYGYPIGHFKLELGLGHDQDQIANNPAAYREYVLSLYASMTGQPPENNPALQRLLAEIPNFDNDDAKSLAKMKSLANAAGYSKTYTPGGNNLDPTMHTVTRAEMQALLDKIRKSCNCK